VQIVPRGGHFGPVDGDNSGAGDLHHVGVFVIHHGMLAGWLAAPLKGWAAVLFLQTS